MASIPYAQEVGSLMHNDVSTWPNYFCTINSLAQFLSIQDSLIANIKMHNVIH